MFTKQHYEAIAKLLREYHQHNGTREYDGGAEVDAMIDQLIGDFGDMLDNDNERFDRVKFLKTIGYGS